MEYFDVIDHMGNPTGEIVERNLAHRTGIPHRTSHVWIFRHKDGVLQVLLQKRCMQKDSFPGCYDISSAGHVTHGQEYLPSALRELHEELGQTVQPEELISCGIHHFHCVNNFRGVPYNDNQTSHVYLMFMDKEAEEFTVQPEEIESVMWIGFEDCVKAVRENEFPNCIELRELQILKDKLIELGRY